MFASKILRTQIKNIKSPACKDCKYFETFIKIYDDKQYEQFGVCFKFGEKDIINGKIKHYLAIDCRNNETLCSLSGDYFKSK
jgi:hypothetical protein